MKKALTLFDRAFILCAFLFLSITQINSQNPGGITGSVAWYKANDGVTTTSTAVTTWSDRSASANHATQAVAANRPGFAANTVNFNPSVTFLTPGTAQFLTTTSATDLPTSDDPRSVFFVASFNNSASTDSWFYGYGGASPAACRKFNIGKLTTTTQLLVSGNTCLLDPANTFWSTTDFPKLGTITYNGTTGIFYDASTVIGSEAFATGFNTQAADAVIGAFHGATTTQYWRGTVAEIIMFPATIAGANAIRVESYLALKYGIHLNNIYVSSAGTTIWDASANINFHNDVFGIIVDNGSALSQLQSNSANTGSGDGTGQTGEGNIVLSATALNNQEYMIVGHDIGNLVFDNTAVPASLSSSHTRVNRTWLINRSATFNSTSVTVQFNYSGLGVLFPSVPDALKLLVDSDGDGDFSNATVINSTSVNTVTSVVTFDIPLTTALNNARFSFAASSAALPVNLKSFGYNTRSCNATLKWTSTNEDKLKSYIVESNTDAIGGWTTVKEIPAAANNLSIEKHYSTEVTLKSGRNNLFRLKMLDIDGSFKYSPTLRIRCEGAAPEFYLMPNPASNHLTIGGIQPGDIIRIYNIKGAFIKSVVTSGNVEELNISSLPAGSYSAEVMRNATRVYSKAFVKTH